MEKIVYVFTYTAYDEEGLYCSPQVFSTLEEAQKEMASAIDDELASDYCHFGGIFKDCCNSDRAKFEEKYVTEKSDVSYHIADEKGYDYFINLDIFTKVIR